MSLISTSNERKGFVKRQLTMPRRKLARRLSRMTGRQHETIKKYITWGSWHRSKFYITYSDEVFAYGDNKFNILGLTVPFYKCEQVERPAKVDMLSGKRIDFIGLGDVFGAALDVEGNLYWWGQNLQNESGIRLPELVVSEHQFKMVSCGSRLMAALDKQGKIYVWGKASDYYNSQSSYHHMEELETEQPVIGLSCGLDHVVAVTTNGEVFTWGSNMDGQRGYTGDAEFNVVKKMDLPEPCTAVTCGVRGTWCLLESGELWACGGNHNGPGALGVANPKLEVFTPEKVLMPDKTLLMLSSWHTCHQAISVAVSSLQRVYWWCERGGSGTCIPSDCGEPTIALLLNVFPSPHDHMYYVEPPQPKCQRKPQLYSDISQTCAESLETKLKKLQGMVGQVQEVMDCLQFAT